jgi:hypothetical protein
MIVEAAKRLRVTRTTLSRIINGVQVFPRTCRCLYPKAWERIQVFGLVSRWIMTCGMRLVAVGPGFAI